MGIRATEHLVEQVSRKVESMDAVRVAYRDDDRTPVIYCIKEIGAKHYGIDVEVLKIKDYGAFEASLFNDSADVLIDHVEFLYAERERKSRSFAHLESSAVWI